MKIINKILIIGFGSIGKRHANNILRITNSQLIIFSKRKNINSKDFFNYSKNKNRIQVISNFDKCLEENPSIAFVTNETNIHVDFALKLAKKNIDLFIEKPLSNSMKNLSKLKSIVRKNKIIVMVGCNFRFYPPIHKIKELVDKRLVGKIISVQSENGSYLPNWHPNEDYSKGYAARSDLGGGVTLTQIHELDYLTWIFGTVKSFYSVVGKFSQLQVTADDTCVCILQLRNNIIIELHLDYFSKPYYKRIKIRGTTGTIYWNSDENRVKLYDNKSCRWKLIKVNNNYKLTGKMVNQMYVDELRYFLQCIVTRNQPMNNLEESSKTLQSALNFKS
jgi:predicted dehydrogenase